MMPEEGKKGRERGLGETVLLPRQNGEAGIREMIAEGERNLRAEQRIVVDRRHERGGRDVGNRFPQRVRGVRKPLHKRPKGPKEPLWIVVERAELLDPVRTPVLQGL